MSFRIDFKSHLSTFCREYNKYFFFLQNQNHESEEKMQVMKSTEAQTSNRTNSRPTSTTPSQPGNQPPSRSSSRPPSRGSSGPQTPQSSAAS